MQKTKKPMTNGGVGGGGGGGGGLFFSSVSASVSSELSVRHRELIFAAISAFGGSYSSSSSSPSSSFQPNTTHFILPSKQLQLLPKNNNNSKLKLVTPEWIASCIRNQALLEPSLPPSSSLKKKKEKSKDVRHVKSLGQQQQQPLSTTPVVFSSTEPTHKPTHGRGSLLSSTSQPPKPSQPLPSSTRIFAPASNISPQQSRQPQQQQATRAHKLLPSIAAAAAAAAAPPPPPPSSSQPPRYSLPAQVVPRAGVKGAEETEKGKLFAGLSFLLAPTPYYGNHHEERERHFIVGTLMRNGAQVDSPSSLKRMIEEEEEEEKEEEEARNQKKNKNVSTTMNRFVRQPTTHLVARYFIPDPLLPTHFRRRATRSRHVLEEKKKRKQKKVVWVTQTWIRNCLDYSTLLPTSAHHLYKPFPSRVPSFPSVLIEAGGMVPEFEGLSISQTGFEDRERSEVMELILLTGANYSSGLRKKRDTHLICLNPTGLKYTKAKEWNVTVVRKSWLLDCLKRWKKLSETLYDPATTKEEEEHCSTQTKGSVIDLTEEEEKEEVPPQGLAVKKEKKEVVKSNRPHSPKASDRNRKRKISTATTAPITSETQKMRGNEVSSKKRKVAGIPAVVPSSSSSSSSTTAPSSSSNKVYRFLLTGTEQQKQEYVGMIQKLKGGMVCEENHDYNPDCTHMILPEMKRTEKFLCACAAGKWILRPQFLRESLNKGCYVAEERFEWHEPKAGVVNRVWMGSPRRLREYWAASHQGPFHNTKILLLGIMSIPEQTLCKTIVAGDGEAFLERELATPEQAEAINVVLLGKITMRTQRDLLRSFAARNVPVLDARYVIDYVTAEQQPNFNDYAAKF